MGSKCCSPASPCDSDYLHPSDKEIRLSRNIHQINDTNNIATSTFASTDAKRLDDNNDEVYRQSVMASEKGFRPSKFRSLSAYDHAKRLSLLHNESNTPLSTRVIGSNEVTDGSLDKYIDNRSPNPSGYGNTLEIGQGIHETAPEVEVYRTRTSSGIAENQASSIGTFRKGDENDQEGQPIHFGVPISQLQNIAPSLISVTNSPLQSRIQFQNLPSAPLSHNLAPPIREGQQMMSLIKESFHEDSRIF